MGRSTGSGDQMPGKGAWTSTDGRVVRRFFYNEANALRLLETYTDIPVPKLIDVGVDDNGLMFIKTQKIAGTIRGDMALDKS